MGALVLSSSALLGTGDTLLYGLGLGGPVGLAGLSLVAMQDLLSGSADAATEALRVPNSVSHEAVVLFFLLGGATGLRKLSTSSISPNIP